MHFNILYTYLDTDEQILTSLYFLAFTLYQENILGQ
jgi:hypothetical protein